MLDEFVSIGDVKGKILTSLDNLMNEVKRLESKINLEKIKVNSISTYRDMETYSNKPNISLNKVNLTYEMYDHARRLSRNFS